MYMKKGAMKDYLNHVQQDILSLGLYYLFFGEKGITIMKATKIKMRPGCRSSQSLLEIDQVYITGCKEPGYYKKEDLHDHLKKHPGTILT